MTYFKPEEFKCPCGTCGLYVVSIQLVDTLNKLRSQLGRPIYVTSGIRCPEQNRRVGGEHDSAHLIGEAADLACGIARERYDLLKLAFPLFKRIGVGRTFIHVDVSPSLTQEVCWLYD